MFRTICFTVLTVVFFCFSVCGQVLQFGKCPDVETVKYFDLERFLGQWYEAARFPTWYENDGSCAYKRIQYCGRRIEIEHVYVRDGIQYVLHVNSTYVPGAEAVFNIKESNVDPVGIPLSIITTDYTNYAIVYGCKSIETMGLKFISAWILSRTPTIDEDIFHKASLELNSVPNGNIAYLETVDQSLDKCSYYWTAHVNAETSLDEENEDEYE